MIGLACNICGACNAFENTSCRQCGTNLYVEPNQADDIDHPKHYARWAMEPIEFIMLNDLPAWMANVIKYIMRYDAKDGIKDMYKARSYLDMKIRQMEGVERFWEKPVAEERKLNAK